MARIIDIEGIGEVYAKALADKGVTTTEALLEKCGTPAGRKSLAKETGLTDAQILKWANRADLARVKGIGGEYGDLLELAGVDTVPALARRNPTNLTKALVEANENKNLVRKLPSEKQVTSWIEQAKALPRVLTY